MPDRRLRDATAADAPALAHLLGQLGYPATTAAVARRLELLMSNGDTRVFVAELDGAVAGFVSLVVEPLLEHEEPVCRLTALAVDESSRRRGLGAWLVGAVEEEARRRGCYAVVLTSGDYRATDAHVFYRGLGYEDTGRRFIKML